MVATFVLGGGAAGGPAGGDGDGAVKHPAISQAPLPAKHGKLSYMHVPDADGSHALTKLFRSS